MTQKSNLFKGQRKNKSVPPNRHGKLPQIRKGTQRYVSVYLYVCIFVTLGNIFNWHLIHLFFRQGKDMWSHLRLPRRWMLIVYVPFSSHLQKTFPFTCLFSPFVFLSVRSGLVYVNRCGMCIKSLISSILLPLVIRQWVISSQDDLYELRTRKF